MEYLNKIAETGIVGVLLALSLLTNFYFYREIKGLQERRIEDIKTMNNALVEPIKAVKQTVELIFSIVNKINQV